MNIFWKIIPLLLLAGTALSGIDDNSIDKVFHYQPEQVHISFGDTTSEITITWSTKNKTESSLVKYGGLIPSFTAMGKCEKFVDGGAGKHFQFIHRVKLSNLLPNKRYNYYCGSPVGWSDQFWFKTPPANKMNWSPRLAVFGDMGVENAQSLERLKNDTHSGMYDAILHVGDFAYDMHSNNSEVGDKFMRLIQPIAAFVPYMTCAGNHEENYNFSNYRARFSMPGGTENLFYSFDLGPVHFIGFSTEVYYFLNYGYKPLINQYNWLVKDLLEANKPENRIRTPWIVTFGHRPMYCSNDNGDDCSKHETVIRKGLPILHIFGLEELFYNNGVDVEIWAHEHSYERLWPIYNYEVYNGSLKEPYRNPGAPVHIVTGSAGCKEGREPFFKNIPEWSAFHSQDYGYTRFTAFNSSHLHFEQISDDNDGQIIDSFWVIKDKHGSYSNL